MTLVSVVETFLITGLLDKKKDFIIGGMTIQQQFHSSFATAAEVLDAFIRDDNAQTTLVEVAERLTATLRAGGKVLIGGNGGSMADALHFAEEWTGRFRKDRRPLPALVLGGDPTHVTCVGNDYGFDQVFARTVQAFATPQDLVILLSTSGNSTNLLRAAESAREVGAPVVGFLGRGGGQLAPLCDLVVMAPGETSDRIQEIHMLALHTLIEVVERALGLA